MFDLQPPRHISTLRILAVAARSGDGPFTIRFADLRDRTMQNRCTQFALAEDPDRVKRLNDLGVARVVPMFPPEKADKVLPVVDRWTKIMQQVNG